MAVSLQDQLLKAGIANKQQAKQAKQEKRKKAKQKKGSAPAPEQDQQAALEAARLAKQEKDRELNRQRQQEQAQKARLAEARQLIQQHAVRLPRDGETRYNFVHESKIKSLWIDNTLLNQLARGQLRIVCFEQQYSLVPAEIAERIEERLPGTLLARPKDETPAEDDPYADYQIPDDLMW